MMAEAESEKGSEIWKIFLRRHWKLIVSFIVGAVLVSICAVIVYLWFVGYAQSSGLVPATLDLWTMGYIVTYILHVIFWEILFIGIPVIIAAVLIYFLWWKRLPAEEKEEYRRGRFFFGTRSRATSGGGGGISGLILIAFCILVFTDGNWDVAFAAWTLDYVVYTCLWALIWVLIIFGIPIAIGVTWWIRHEMKKKP